MHHLVLGIRTTTREEMVDVTAEIRLAILATGVENGIATIFVPHTTAAVTLNENADPDVQRDWLLWMRQAVSPSPEFRHAEGNSDAHIKASLVGSSVQVPLVRGALRLGRWQGIYFCEFDGPRR